MLAGNALSESAFILSSQEESKISEAALRAPKEIDILIDVLSSFICTRLSVVNFLTIIFLFFGRSRFTILVAFFEEILKTEKRNSVE